MRSSVPPVTRPRAGSFLATLSALAVLAAMPRDASAQSYLLARGVSLSAGVAEFDLNGSSVTPIVALRGDAELTPWLVGELGVSAIRPNERFASRLTYVVPEIQLQFQRRAGRLRPYVGAGGGWFAAIGPDREGQGALTASAAAGLRFDFEDVRFGLRTELRVRGMDRDFDRRVREWTGGMVWRF
jgi:hypothetical protein